MSKPAITIKDLPAKELEDLVAETRRFLDGEHGLELGRFEAEAMIGFFLNALGTRCYNRGLQDAHGLFRKTMEDVVDGIEEMTRYD